MPSWNQRGRTAGFSISQYPAVTSLPQPNYELELARLVLQGKNVDYEELPAEDQELTFSFLEKKAKEETGIESLSRDVLKTLNLYSDAQGYNRAAELLADKNDYPGIDIVRFGVDINTILMFDDNHTEKTGQKQLRHSGRERKRNKIQTVTENL